ncbi:uncharacterized protein At4g15970-like [Wolffia australiana]
MKRLKEQEGTMRTLLLSLLVIAGVAFLYALSYHNVAVFNFLPMSRGSFEHPNNTSATPRKDDSSISGSDEIKLKTVLEKAAMGNNTVILTSLNEAWAAPGSIIELFLESFWTGEHISRLLEHLVIIALDEKAYARCRSTHVNCYPLKTEGVDFSAEKKFMTEDYLKMVWRKIEFLRSVLELGYSFIFTDADVIWFRDPMQVFHPNGDFQISCDSFYGDPDYLSNTLNTGFMYVRANEKTKLLYKYWYESRETHPGMHDQEVLNHIKGHQYVLDIGLNFNLIPTVYFGGICQPSSDFNLVCTMHANCCIGLEHKLNDIRIIMEDWRMYRVLKGMVNNTHKSKWRVPQMC